MTHRTKILFLFASLAAVATPLVDAQQSWKESARAKSKQARRDAREFQQLQVPGETVALNVRKLRRELHWHSTLSGALRAGQNQGKPVVWIQALGDLDGFL